MTAIVMPTIVMPVRMTIQARKPSDPLHTPEPYPAPEPAPAPVRDPDGGDVPVREPDPLGPDEI